MWAKLGKRMESFEHGDTSWIDPLRSCLRCERRLGKDEVTVRFDSFQCWKCWSSLGLEHLEGGQDAVQNGKVGGLDIFWPHLERSEVKISIEKQDKYWKHVETTLANALCREACGVVAHRSRPAVKGLHSLCMSPLCQLHPATVLPSRHDMMYLYVFITVTEDWSRISVLPRDRQFPHDHPICSPIFSAGGVGFWVLTTLSLPLSTTKKSQVSLLRWTACNSSSTPWDIEIQQRPKFGTVWSLESPRSRGELKLIAKGNSDSWAMMIIDVYND